MSDFRVTRQTPTAIKVEHITDGEIFPFVVLNLGHDGDRTLTHAPEATGRQSFQGSSGDLYSRARAFAESVMLEAGAIDRSNPP